MWLILKQYVKKNTINATWKAYLQNVTENATRYRVKM